MNGWLGVPRRGFAGLRAWNRRSVAWSRRHPWRHGALFATAYLGVQVAIRLGRDDDVSWLFFGVSWLVLVFVSGLFTRAYRAAPPAEPVLRPSSDLTLSGSSDGMGDAGRRWRTGSP